MTSPYFEIKEKTISYEQYDSLINTLLDEGKSTGEKQTPKRTEVSRLNAYRMARVHKTTKLSEQLVDLAKSAREQFWMVLTEGWCGDSAHAIPVLDLVAKASDGRIRLGMLLRDDNLEVMDQYLVNGGRSIPRLVAFDLTTGDEIGTWGPRPEPVQKMMADFKANPDDTRDIQIEMQQWYNADRSKTFQEELLALLSSQ
jgi:thioredoxin-like negative regulator of GroEL